MIINSMLDLDLYKLTQQQAVLHQFPGTEVEYEFHCRNTPEVSLGNFYEQIKDEVRHLCTLRFTQKELDYLSTIRYLKKDYIQFLKYFQLDFNNVFLILTKTGISITIKGNWRDTILFETFILSIVNEVYMRYMINQIDEYDLDNLLNDAHDRLNAKINFIKENPFNLIEFGTRRRQSRNWQKHVVSRLKDEVPESLFGTSNVYLAKKYNLRPMGTMAHELFMACQQIGPKLKDAQKFALQKWADEYRGDLGIALTDTYGVDAFLKDFDLYFAKLYDGVRHDSGCPFEFGEKIIKHYESMGIDPKSKIIVFSDGLNVELASKLHKTFNDRIKTSYGIGTNLTNDFFGLEALQIVIKMSECQGMPVAKISDTPGKTTCKDEEFIKYMKSVYKIDY